MSRHTPATFYFNAIITINDGPTPARGSMNGKKRFIIRWIMFGAMLCIYMPNIAFALPSAGALSADSGLPPGTKVTKLGDEIYLNGIPALIIAIASPVSVKEASKFFTDRWSADGWKVTLGRNEDDILVMATDGNYQKVASLSKTGPNSTEGSISLTDMPLRLATGEGEQLPVGTHLIKPINSMVLNEVRIRDSTGEAITTTLTNQFDVEQNAAFYEERMVEDGWKMKKRKTVEDSGSVIEVFDKPGKESTFTFVRSGRQSYITVNWINR